MYFVERETHGCTLRKIYRQKLQTHVNVYVYDIFIHKHIFTIHIYLIDRFRCMNYLSTAIGNVK